MQRLLSLGASTLCAALAAGCMRPVPHAWQACGTDRFVVVPIDTWVVLPKDQYCRVIPAEVARAAEKLAERPFVVLEGHEARALAGERDWAWDKAHRPYLVRGVAYSGKPLYTIVRFEAKLGLLAIHHATYDCENLLTAYACRRARPCPLVVLLPGPPAAVYPTADVGGDRVFRGRDFKTLDTR